MDSAPVTGKKRQTSRSSRAPAKIHCLGDDILCLIFSFVDHLDLVRCSVVCKSWNEIVYKSKLLQSSYFKMMQLGLSLEELAIERHGSALREGEIEVNQWSGHSIGMNQCRMRMGMLLTGVGDKVMRLWSLESYKCVEEYSIPYNTPLVDFGFDENKIVGLIGTRICIWKRNGTRSIFPSREGTFPKGLCMRYFDPEAVVGCEDGTAHVFDMYSRKCSEIIRMHLAPVRCICLSDDQLIISGSTLGDIAISGLSSNQPVANLRSTDRTDIRALCFNPRSHLVFSGSTAGYTSCWDIRMMKTLWEKKVSPNIIYSLGHVRNDKSWLVVGGIDGVLRVLDQNTGAVLSGVVSEGNISSSQGRNGVLERKKGRRLAEDTRIDKVPLRYRPPITCLAVGMKKVVTTHNSKDIRLWKFSN
ncbi:hypothetical protein UlMin_007408 [Ulmus minor]